jgi:hypothetical protein
LLRFGTDRKLKEKKDAICLMATAITFSVQSPFRPLFAMLALWSLIAKLKRGEMGLGFHLAAYRFRSNNRTKPMMMAMSIAVPKPMMYVSVIGAGVGVGAGVATGASSTFIAVSASEGQ